MKTRTVFPAALAAAFLGLAGAASAQTAGSAGAGAAAANNNGAIAGGVSVPRPKRLRNVATVIATAAKIVCVIAIPGQPPPSARRAPTALVQYTPIATAPVQA